ncbi:MAG: HEAT repeat domain-containing protein [Candidatus Lokiarchaeota archaeon]|nr:HEAT repeat domain-containing protein [Candidatus Lokiarchaeota archaeon]
MVFKLAPKVRGKYIDELLEELSSIYSSKGKESPSKLKNTIDKIGNLADKKAIPALLPCLDHEADYVRAAAIYALEKIHDYKELPQLLLRKMAEEKSQIALTAIIESLGELDDPSAIPVLERIRDDPQEDDRTKITAIFAIDRLSEGKKSALEQLVEYLIDARNPNTRVEAAKALGKLGDPRAIKYLVEALDDEKVFVRKFVIKALVSFGDKQVVEPVIKAFTDESVLIDRDFVKVLWSFPDYDGKELWEIIDLCNQEKLCRLKESTPNPGTPADPGAGPPSQIKDDYAYESAIGASKDDKPATASEGNQQIANQGMESESTPRDSEDVALQRSKTRAKQEKVPPLDEANAPEDPGKGSAGITGALPAEAETEEGLKEFGEYFNKGEKHYRKKHYYDAVINFKKAIEVKYDAWQAWFNLALVFYDIDEKAKSIECFKNALRYKPNEVDTMLNLSSLYDELGDYQTAIRYLTSAVDQSRFLPDAWLKLGKLFIKTRDEDFAYFCFNQVLQLSREKKERNEARDNNERIMKSHPRIEGKDPRKEKPPGIEKHPLKLDLEGK